MKGEKKMTKWLNNDYIPSAIYEHNNYKRKLFIKRKKEYGQKINPDYYLYKEKTYSINCY